jgi:hypothetical protein
MVKKGVTTEGEWISIHPPSEWEEQRQLCQWLLAAYPDVVFFSVPNEGNRTDYRRFRMHQTGMLSGMPDLVILFNPPLFVEMKRAKGGVVSANQKEVHEWIRNMGYTVLVCKGFADAEVQISKFALQHCNRRPLCTGSCPKPYQSVAKTTRKARSK